MTNTSEVNSMSDLIVNMLQSKDIHGIFLKIDGKDVPGSETLLKEIQKIRNNEPTCHVHCIASNL